VGGYRGILKPKTRKMEPCKSMKHHHFLHNSAVLPGKRLYRHVGLSNPRGSDVCEHCGWLRSEILAHQQTQPEASA